MIHGIGNDIIEVKRVLDKIASETGLKETLFTEQEIKYCETKKNMGENLEILI